MRRYLDNAIGFDFVFTIIIGFCLYYGKPILKTFLSLPTYENLNNFSVSLITVSATLIGFLLTIITVVVTFKKGFEETKDEPKLKSAKEHPEKTIFDRQISKETKFYGTEIHKKVVNVFVYATYEIGFVLLTLLILQFNICKFSIFWTSIISCCIFILIILSIFRCLYIFQLFLQVHLHNKSLKGIDDNKNSK